MPLALYSWAWLCRSRLRSPVTVTRFGLQPVRVTTPTARFCHLSASQVKEPNEQGKIAKWRFIQSGHNGKGNKEMH